MKDLKNMIKNMVKRDIYFFDIDLEGLHTLDAH